jgi:prepilin-type N-terminal cleavage/methylation domain-containing protein
MLHAPDTSVSSVLKRGFSLIELSIVVAILSIVSVLGLEVATSFIGARAYDRTKEQLKVIDPQGREGAP